jgi:adenine deaminase
VYAALVDRAGKWVSHAIIDNFMADVEGFASTYNTTTHLLCIGKDPNAIAIAATRVKEMGGGVVLVEDGKPVLEIPLPFTGMMTSSLSFETAVRYQNALFEAVTKRGYPFHDILYSLLFLTCDFLPGLRLTPRGLIDVKAREVLRRPVTDLANFLPQARR